ncbi:MAG: VIT domain-containing protein [Myxococcota bacterium]
MLLVLLAACLNPTPSYAAAEPLTWTAVPSGHVPMSLTAADGTGLRLAEMHVDAVVDGPLAFTELHLVFDNPEDRRIEGRFEITLPTGAAVSRFAMKLGEVWQEGEVVELQAARRAYEDFLHRRTDPALLEYDAGNEFRARVFPIEPHSKKELIISWSHDLDAGEPWSLPTGGLPELGVLTAAVSSGGTTYRMETEYQVPEGDLTLPSSGPANVALRGEHTSVVRVQPELAVSKDPVKNATVLVDTSASRALSFEALLADLAAVIPTFSGDVRVLAYDQEVVEIHSGPAKGFGKAALEKLRTREALGASDLSAALAKVGQASRVVVFTDAVTTAGERDAAKVRATLKKSSIQRLDVVLRGGARDEAAAAQWVSALPRDGVVLDADAMGASEVSRRLGLGTAGVVEVSVPGSEWIWPTRIAGLQPGDSVTVYADLPARQPLDVQLDGKSVGSVQSRTSSGPLLVRASAQAEIQALQDRESRAESAEERDALAERIVEVSTKNRVLSPHTALLVLETEADYERFGIPRNALTDILVVENGDLGWLERKKPVFTDASQGSDAPVDESRTADAPDEDEKSKEKKTMAAPEADAAPAPPPASRPARPAREARADRAESGAPAMEEREYVADDAEEAPSPVTTDPRAAWEGDYLAVMIELEEGRLEKAEALALAWRERAPGDPLALLALGEVWQRQGRLVDAARVYGSLIDLFPSRADLRRLAGERLETLGDTGLPLATDTFRVAVEQRADHPSSHRLLAWSLAKAGKHAEALKVLRTALEQPFDRFEAAHRILREDAGLIAAAWRAQSPTADVAGALKGMEAEPAKGRALRFVLNWETDANDVDFHIYDSRGGHAYYSDRTLPSGGELYADITSGYGPECFAIARPDAFPYTLQAHYYSRGPMGFGMGKLQIIEHDGEGHLHFDERPFVVMTDGAFVPLGAVEASAFAKR